MALEGFYSIDEIAQTKDVHRTTIARRRKKEEWPLPAYRPTQGGRNGFEEVFDLKLLPTDIQQAFAEREIGSDPAAQLPAVYLGAKELAPVEEPPEQTLAAMKGWQRRVYDARCVILHELVKLEAMLGTNQAIARLVELARAGGLPEPLQAVIPAANARGGRTGSRTLSRSSILRWRRLLRAGGPTALAPRQVEKTTIPAWASYFLKCYQQPQKPSIPEAMEELACILPDHIPMPSYAQVLRFHRKRSALDCARGRMTGSELKSKKGFIRRDTSELQPLDLGVCDGHSFKARVAHPSHGRSFHPEVCAVIDAATRVVVGWSAGLSESAMTVADAVRHAATVTGEKRAGGVFAILYTDGGSGNMAKVNADEIAGLFPRLGTTHKTGIAGNSQARGLIEILNKTLWIRAAKKLNTYTGKDMDQLTARNVYLLTNKEIKKNGASKRLIPWKAFLSFLAEQVEAYNRRPHRALPKITDPETGRKRHMAPFEMWAWFVAQGWQAAEHQLDPAEIDVLFRPRIKKPTRRGEIKLFGNVYYNALLAHYDGREVYVAYEVQDGSKVQVWDLDERFVCHAFFEKNKKSYFPVSAVENARDDRAKRRAKIKMDQLAEIEEERSGAIEIEQADGLLDELAAKYNAAAAIEPPVEKAAEVKPAKVLPLWQTMTERYQYIQQMQEELSADDIEFLLDYYQTTAGKMYLKLDGDLVEKSRHRERQEA